MILGIDEAGRGPWAGPLVVGAVVLGGAEIDGLTDSKKLTKKKRELLYDEIVERAQAATTGWVRADELDEVGMSEALRLATRRAVEKIKVPYSEIIIDGTINFLADTGKGKYVTTMPKADLLVPSVSAASIMAKVERDRYMTEQDELYPEYGFGSHAGYGVAKHRVAIAQHGVTPLHRLSFAPLRQYKKPNHPPAILPVSLATPGGVGGVSSPGKRLADDSAGVEHESTKKIGDRAEDEATNYLVRLGHEIIDRNWKTKYCEIDIVSQKDGTWYFTEVKYRRQSNQGGGLAAITQKKLNQMRYAAKFYVHSQKITDMPLQISVISLNSTPPVVEEYFAEV